MRNAHPNYTITNKIYSAMPYDLFRLHCFCFFCFISKWDYFRMDGFQMWFETRIVNYLLESISYLHFKCLGIELGWDRTNWFQWMNIWTINVRINHLIGYAIPHTRHLIKQHWPHIRKVIKSDVECGSWFIVKLLLSIYSNTCCLCQVFRWIIIIIIWYHWEPPNVAVRFRISFSDRIEHSIRWWC